MTMQRGKRVTESGVSMRAASVAGTDARVYVSGYRFLPFEPAADTSPSMLETVHQLRNLLFMISSSSECLSEASSLDEQGRELVEAIARSSQGANVLVRQILAQGRQRIWEPVPVDLTQAITAARCMYQRMLPSDVVFKTRLEPSLKPILMDPRQLDQVITNLVVNARDAMPLGGELAIETAIIPFEGARRELNPRLGTGPCAQLAVHDTGIGMDQATQDRMFDPFFTTKEAGRGTGLGLASVREIVQRCGGSIGVRSALGAGTSVCIYFPMVS